MILTRSTRLSQPQGPVEVDQQNVYANGIEFAYIPGFSRDLTRKSGAIQAVGPNTTFLNGTMVTPGTDRNNGLILATGALLGPMQKSTVLAIANTSAGIIPAGGLTTDGLIGAGGNALYSERAPTGNDIYKLGLAATGGPTLNAEFVYRNDGGNILQQRVNIGTASADGRMLAIAAVKSGTAHSVYCNTVSSVGTSGSASSAFTNANIQRRIGSDVADGTCAWNGQILLVAGWSRALSADEIAGLRDNPWQLFRPVQRRVYFDMGAGGGAAHIVTADPVDQGSTTTRPGLTQTHITTARAVAQGATVSRPAFTQTHVVTARAVAQGSTVNAPAVEVGSITVVTARPVVQSSTVNAPSIVQTHVLTARPSAQGVTVTRPGLTQTHTVTARAVTQSSVVNAPSVDVGSTPSTFVTARPVAQGSSVNAPGIRQTHVTSAREVVQRSTINAPGLVQAHVVAARPVVQAGSVNKPWVTTGSGTFTGLSPADLAAIRAAVRAELHAELTAIFQIQTKVDAAL